MNRTGVLLALAVSIYMTHAGHSQISQGGTPLSFRNHEISDTAPLFVTMPAVDVARLRMEDSINDRNKEIPWRFGENMQVDHDLNNSGSWTVLPKGDRVWRLGIRSAGAYTINLTFDKYHLPPGATLFVYNTDHSHVIGAFTDQNNQADYVFATTLVRGDAIVMEYYEPPKPAFPGELHLNRVTHGYRDAYGYARSFGSSGACENNVNCPEAVGWENQVRSVCMLVSGGSGFCTGALVNNTSQNGIPYILTANHCYSDPSSWVFWFNWQSPTCANPSSSPPYNSMSGATLKARKTDSDFCLVQMNSTAPAGYNVYYAGWNREDAAATSGAGIHHPSGDIKKISYSATPFTSDTWSGTPANSHWRVDWSDGVTEPGSSGSPMFDQNHRVVGQLHGGPSACGASQLWDYYGKFSMSWAQGTTSATRLKDWLDPTNIAGLTLDGYDPNVVTGPPVADFIADNTTPGAGTVVNFTDLSGNSPTSWNWSFSPATIVFSGGTNATSRNPQVAFSVPGFYTVTLVATNSYGSDTKIKTNYINAINCTISTFPWTEGFENAGNIPACWMQELVNNSGLYWTFITGNGSGNPGTAHNGTYNACLKDNTIQDNKTRLITPPLDLSGLPNPQVKFWHTQAFWNPDQDILTVFYKTFAGGTWTLLATYTSNITAWTQETIALPAASSDYFIAFEGNAKYGYGVCVDDVEVSTSCATTYPVSISIAASQNPVNEGTPVTFTATPVNGGTTPSYQWKVNSANAGTNNALFTYVPVSGDQVSCILTSNATCATGNPATSNVITMTVNSVPANLNLNNITVTGSQCYNATQTITVAGGGSTFTVPAGSQATMIAGLNVLYEPGTAVNPGGYLHGYISPGGPWCAPVAKGSISTGTDHPEKNRADKFFRVCPNPTTGTFTVEMNPSFACEAVLAEVYNMKGERLLAYRLAGAPRHLFSLAGEPAGIYLVRITSDMNSGIARIIKQ